MLDCLPSITLCTLPYLPGPISSQVVDDPPSVLDKMKNFNSLAMLSEPERGFSGGLKSRTWKFDSTKNDLKAETSIELFKVGHFYREGSARNLHI